jgi:hypothetical protein
MNRRNFLKLLSIAPFLNTIPNLHAEILKRNYLVLIELKGGSHTKE